MKLHPDAPFAYASVQLRGHFRRRTLQVHQSQPPDPTKFSQPQPVQDHQVQYVVPSSTTPNPSTYLKGFAGLHHCILPEILEIQSPVNSVPMKEKHAETSTHMHLVV